MNEIKKIRQELGLTQVEFARVLNISRRTMQQWELGIADPMRLAYVEKIKKENY